MAARFSIFTEFEARTLWLRYALALSLFAALGVCVLMVVAPVSVALHRAEGDINLSGQQRMLSQRIALLATQAAQAGATPSAADRRSLADAIDLFDAANQRLARQAEPNASSNTGLRDIYSGATRLEARSSAFVSRARKIGDGVASTGDLALLRAEADGPLLAALDRAVTAFESRAHQLTNRIGDAEWAAAGAGLLLILFEALFIFLPAHRVIALTLDRLSRRRDRDRDAIQRLVEAERLAKLAEETAGLGHWTLDAATRQIRWSPQVFRIHGFARTAGEPPLDDAIAAYHPDDRAAVQAHVARALEWGVPFDFRLRLMRADGALRHVTCKADCERDKNGVVVSVFGVFQDVTEHALALEAVEATAVRAQLAEEIAGLGHWRVEYPSHALTWSEQMYVIYGLEPGATIDVDLIMGMVHPDDRVVTLDRLQRDLAGEVAAERPLIRVVRPDGDIRWVIGDTRVERGGDGRPQAMFGTLRDVTRETVAERRLEASEARYRRLADYSTDVIVKIGADGAIVYVSPACAAFGYAPQDLIGRPPIEFVHPEDHGLATEMVRRLLAGEPIDRRVRREYRLRCKDGSYRWIEGNPSLVPIEDGSHRILTVYRDVTERRVLEDALMAARAEAEQAAGVKSEFLANMSHELRTPLTSIQGFGRLLDEQPDLSETARRFLSRILTASDGLLALISDILDFSKLEAGQVEIERQSCSVAGLLDEVVALLTPQAEQKSLRLSAEVAGEVPDAVMADRVRLRQVLFNLAGNAIKFSKSGAVSLTATFDPAEQRLRINVKDTGAGIPADRLNRLFLRFSQVDGSTTRLHGGTGLGLAICKGLVDAMGGVIGVESAVGVGSTFWFELPTPSATFVPDAFPGALSFEGFRILIVDDQPATRELVAAVLQTFGVETSDAGDGAEAVRMAATAPYDLILMDLHMPVLDGVAATAAIRGGRGPNAHIPIMAFSAEAGPDREMFLRNAGFDGRIAKPFDPQVLVETLGVILLDRIEQPMAEPSSVA